MILQHIFDSILTTFEYLPTAAPAILVGVLIALCASLLGVPLVLKRFSFIGDGLSHVAFGAYSIALVLSVDQDMLLILPITVIVAVLLLKGGQHSKIRGDASLAMMSVSAMGLGYLILNAFKSGSAVDVCNTLFGSNSILTLTTTEVILSIVMAAIVIILFVLFYRQIFTVTFDESFATATGVNAELYNLMIAVITAIVIVIAMNLVGSLLISALIIFPALSSMRLFKNFRSVILSSAIIAMFAAAIGILASFISLPATGGAIQTGPAIVAINLLIFLTFTAIAFFKRGNKTRKLIGWIVAGILAAALAGCITVDLISLNAGSEETDISLDWEAPYEIDQSLVPTDTISPTTIYIMSEEILNNPQDYNGQTIQVEGSMIYSGEEYDGYCVEVNDDTGCCISQLPVIVKGEDFEYPAENAYILVTGTIVVDETGFLWIDTDSLKDLDYMFEI
ncbi:MAG: metal ABC transporter permease [Clostridia bacterium]|nr:metal ABC transporter permease [Clostridia bacterium]